MSDGEDQKKLLEKTESGSSYGSETSQDDRGGGQEEPSPRYTNPCLQFLYVHRAKIPGYGSLQLMRKAKPYALYVLFALLIAYLLNQLDRYTLPVVTSKAGAALEYGDKACREYPHLQSKWLNASNGSLTKCPLYGNAPCDNLTDLCTKDDYEINGTELDFEGNEDTCNSLNFTYNGTFHQACQWWYEGSGIEYQIVAGPVFNTIYVFAGIFTGFIADFWNRKVFLVISLVLWSIATGLTGFAQTYWHLVLLRALLAIGAAGCSPFAVSIISDYFDMELRGSAIGVYYWGIYFGYSLSYAIGTGVSGSLSWRWVFFISAIMGLVVAPVILLTVKEPERKSRKLTDQERERSTEPTTKLSFGRRLLLIAQTFFMPGMLMLCFAAGIRNAGGYVWAYNTELFYEDVYDLSAGHISRYMSWIPLVGGSLGAVLGGLISDLVVANRGAYARITVLVVSQVLASPFAAGALFLPDPWCFLSLIPANVIGEMWIGVASALVVDICPTKIRTTCIAIYLFIITMIGGNFNLLVPPLQSRFENAGANEDDGLRWALLVTYPGVYFISAFLFLAAFFLTRIDIRRKRRVDEYTLNNGTSEGTDE